MISALLDRAQNAVSHSFLHKLQGHTHTGTPKARTSSHCLSDCLAQVTFKSIQVTGAPDVRGVHGTPTLTRLGGKAARVKCCTVCCSAHVTPVWSMCASVMGLKCCSTTCTGCALLQVAGYVEMLLKAALSNLRLLRRWHRVAPPSACAPELPPPHIMCVAYTAPPYTHAHTSPLVPAHLHTIQVLVGHTCMSPWHGDAAWPGARPLAVAMQQPALPDGWCARWGAWEGGRQRRTGITGVQLP